MSQTIRRGDIVEITIPGDDYGRRCRVTGRADDVCYLDCHGDTKSAHASNLKRVGGGWSLDELLTHPRFRTLTDGHGRGLVQALYQLVNCTSLDNLDYASSVLAEMGIDPAHLGGKPA